MEEVLAEEERVEESNLVDSEPEFVLGRDLDSFEMHCSQEEDVEVFEEADEVRDEVVVP